MAAPNAVKTGIIIFLYLALGFSTKAQLAANFTATPVSGCTPLVVNFSDLSTGNPVQWHWNLGNATISFLQNPSATYFAPGQYTVTLIVTNAAGISDTLTKTQYITVNGKPTVNFTAAPLTGCYPLPVHFTDQSVAGSGTVSAWLWDFGDGISSTLQNPLHTYTGSGNYNVSLRVTNSAGCINVLTKSQYVKISTGVHAAYTNSVPSSCNPPSIINFTNQSTGSGTLSYQWTFGDGGTSTLTNPSHTYVTAGTYTVRLITTNNTGCKDTITKTNSIIIGSVHAGFSSNSSVCVNSALAITNTSLPNPVSSAWDFGDGTTSTATNPVKIYTAAGVYTIRLVANFGACNDTAYSSVTVLAKPVADFTGINTSACKAPLTVNFTSTTIGFGNSFHWDFGDGNTSTAANPTNTYNTAGIYDVTLIVTNLSGCSDTMRKVAFVKIQPPHASIDNLPKSDCAPLTWHFTATVNAVDPVIGYEWDFGDGNTSTSSNPTHTFPAGTYTIRLIVTTAGGCKDTTTAVDGIVASVKPVANFVANPLDVCAHVPVNFTDLSTGTVNRWLWNFGDGGTSTSQNPVHLYEDTGYFTIQLIVWNSGCPDTIRFVNYIHIKPPIANFTAAFNCVDPRIQTFTDHSIGADVWNWNFGDGATSTQPSPVHTYADTGTYLVTLTVRNNTTGCEHTKTLSVKVIIEKANFIATDSVICKNNPTSFSTVGIVPANIATYNWDFGDGATATGANPLHTYTSAGSYSVQLIITDILGCSDTLTKALYIRVDGPTAGFVVDNPGNCISSNVTFTDHSVSDGTHPIMTWIWDYGDGIIDTLHTPPFQHSYTAPGFYTITLKVIDSKGCIDTVTIANAVTISYLVAGFSTADTLSCPGKNISFVNESTGTTLQYTWNFGDGNTSIASNPVHVYSADGLYTIKLIATDQYGCTDTMRRVEYVKIASPHASFLLSDSISTCPPLFVNFTNTSSNVESLNWDFGDGTSTQTPDPSHFYSLPGIYYAKLTVTSAGGCIDTISKKITVRGPVGSFSYLPSSGCRPLTINFIAVTQDRLSFIWDFNDGNIVNTNDSLIAHTYTTPGLYVPKMILVDTSGCQVPITGIDTIHVNGVTAGFNFINQAICDSGSVAFTDISAGNESIASYAWNFGDGNTSTLQNPTHYYTATGIYYPKLIVVSQSGCRDTATAVAPIKIVGSPNADFNKSPNGCAPLTVTFNGQLNIPDTSVISWNWSFGNGNISILQNPPPQLYNTAGTYNIKLIATNSTGCKDTVTKTVDAFLVPTIDAGVDTMVCRGSSITLRATGAATYTWSPSLGLSCNNCANPAASPDSLTKYIVKGTTAQGCSNTDTVVVKVKQRFVMNNSVGDTLCKGGAVRLFASGANSYQWSPFAGLTSTTSSTPLASPATTTIYRVIGKDDAGCFQDTGYVTVKVYPIPVVNAGENKSINAGQTIDLTPVVSPDVSTVLWSPTASIVRNNNPGVTVKPKETTEYTIEVRNAGGCRSRDKVTVFVICNGANVFIPNTFSPNGDGMNDVFYPRGSGLFSIKSFRIFNRWGEVMYEKNGFMPNDASAGWDGKHNGQMLNTDVFVYTIEIICDNSSTLVFKGNVALIH
jgi:gliding motility-associated-like protein